MLKGEQSDKRGGPLRNTDAYANKISVPKPTGADFIGLDLEPNLRRGSVCIRVYWFVTEKPLLFKTALTKTCHNLIC